MMHRFITSVLLFVGISNLTGCGLIESWYHGDRPSRISTGIANPYHRPSIGGGGDRIIPPTLPDRLPGTPKFLPMSGKNTPEPRGAIEIVPEAVQTINPVRDEANRSTTPSEGIKTTTGDEPIQVPPPLDTPKIIDVTPAAPPVNLIVPTKAIATEAANSDAYSPLVGQVQQYRKAWRLRYASIEQDDPHGGVVLLEGDVDFGSLRDGMMIRVRGVLIPAETRTDAARYRVQRFDIVE